MPKKALASLNVVINAVTKPLFRGLNRASKRLAVFGTQMKAVGRSITTSFSVPFAAIGVAGAKMAVDFEKNMTKINTLVGVSAKEVNQMSKEVMSLSGATAQAPADLADGLFFLTSAGLRGANAMETLEQVSKGVAIGLGEQSDLAKVAAAAQNAYGKENLTASKALDIFGKSVQSGMFEASDLAGVLGTQLGMAAELGISFEETNAFISTYTKTTGDANAATTSFGGVMMALAKTTPQMENALNQVGMTGDSVRQMLGDQGLRQTLINIKTAFEEQGVPLTKFFSKSQALKGVLGVLGNQTETYGEILDGMNQSVGMVDDGFGTLEQTAGFKMQQSFQNLKNAAMELGAMLMPVFTSIVEGATKLAKAFTELDDGTKKLIVGAAALFAFSGPLFTLAGGLVSVIGMILSPIGLVVVALGVLFGFIVKNWSTVRKVFVDFVNYFIELYNESMLVRYVVEGFIFTFKTVLAAGILFGKSVVDIFVGIKDAFMGVIGGIGDILMGIFTLDKDRIKKGFNQAKKSIGDSVKKTFESIGENVKEFGEVTGENFGDAVENVINGRDLKFITEDDVQNTVDNIGNFFKKKLAKAKDMIQGFLGGGGVTIPGTGGGGEGEGEPEGTGGEDGSKELEKSIEKKKSLIQQYLEWAATSYEDFAGKVEAVWQNISSVAGQALDGITKLFSAQNEKQMTMLDNLETKENEKLNADFEREKLRIENSIINTEMRDEKLNQLKEKFGEKQDALDKKMDEKRKAIQKKQAVREKGLKIADAIMGTAAAIVQALGAGPIAGPILAAIVGGLGAAQIATIASTPIPLAKGGLAFGPTQAIVGDNPGAANDPEVIAPLSKLKSMLGGEMNVRLNVSGELMGNDIFLSNEQTGNQRLRYI